ncbi:MAG: sugar ABC transporter substrate-binding protein [Deltaproteobacteria bacterium]|nr:sugar ABC transporter substrate-binding protein [Deltaproteobacteria bacterium]
MLLFCSPILPKDDDRRRIITFGDGKTNAAHIDFACFSNRSSLMVWNHRRPSGECVKASKKKSQQVVLFPRVAGDGPEGMERQIHQMNELLDLKVDALIVQPTDAAALEPSPRRANQMKIPVVAYDQYILGGKLAAYITSINRQAGFLDGEFIASRFDDKHEIKPILIEYPHVSSTVERLDGFF